MNSPAFFYDRIREATTTSGTGTITLSGAVSGYQAFSTVGNGALVYYVIADQAGGNWETGIGTYTLSGTTLARTTVLASSNAGSLVSFGSNTKDVFASVPAFLLNRVPYTLFDHYADGSSTSTNGTFDTLYTDTLAGNALLNVGDKIIAQYTLTFVSSATATREVKLAFAGNTILDTGALTFTSTGTATIDATIIEASSTSVRVMTEFVPSGLTQQPIVTYTLLTGLTLTGTNILLLTGAAASTGAASGDIVAKLGTIYRLPAA